MFDITKLNHKPKFPNYDTHDKEYLSLSDMYNNYGKDAIYIIRAIFVNTKSKFGDAPVFGIDEGLVNVPKHVLENAKTLLENEDAIKAINNGECGFKVVTYHSGTYNRDCFSVEFVTIEKN